MFQKLTPNLLVTDVAQTANFYQSVLGFAIVATVPETAPFNWAMIQRQEVTLMLQARATEELAVLKDQPGGGALTLYIDVVNVQELLDDLRGKTPILADLYTTFYGTTEFVIQDPNGFVLVFAQTTV